MTAAQKRVLIVATVTSCVLLVASLILIAKKPRTVIWGADCYDIGATARFSDNSPAECVSLNIPELGITIDGGVWLWPKWYRPEPGSAVECIDVDGPPGATKLCS